MVNFIVAEFIERALWVEVVVSYVVSCALCCCFDGPAQWYLCWKSRGIC